MADDQVSIHFKTTAEIAGAQAAANAIDSVTGATDEAAEASKQRLATALQEASAVSETAQANEQLAAAERDAARAADQAAQASAARARAAHRESQSEGFASASGARLTNAGAAAEESQRVFGDVASSARAAEVGVSQFGAKATVATAAAAALYQILQESLSAFSESEIAATHFANALEKTGQSGGTVETQIAALAANLQRFTNVSDETWTEAAAKLVEFGAKAEELPGLMKTVEDMAGRMGGNVEQAAEVVARAVAGNTRGLAQFGIELADGASKAEILAAVSEAAATGAGKLRKETETLAGAWAAFKITAGDAMEALGGLINSGDWLTKTLRFMADGGVAPARDRTKELAEAQKELKQFTDEVTGSVEAWAKSLGGEGTTTTKALAGQVQQLADSYDALNEKAKRAAEGQNKIAAAQKDLKLAQIDTAQEKGMVGERDAIRARANVEIQSAKESAAAAKERREAEIASLSIQNERLQKEAEYVERSGQSTEEAEKAKQIAAEQISQNQQRIEQLNEELAIEGKLTGINQTKLENEKASKLAAYDAKQKAAAEKKEAEAAKDAAEKKAKAEKEAAEAKEKAAKATEKESKAREKDRPGHIDAHAPKSKRDREMEAANRHFFETGEPAPSADINTQNRTVPQQTARVAAEAKASGDAQLSALTQILADQKATNAANERILQDIINELRRHASWISSATSMATTYR